MLALVRSSEPWLDKHIKSFIRQHAEDVIFFDDVDEIRPGTKNVLQICGGAHVGQHLALLDTTTGLINAYPNSDALARKDHLAMVVEYWTAKRTDSILKNHVPGTVRLNLDYSEYVEDSLLEADDLSLYHSLQKNEKKDASNRKWWILKPALFDGGDGIRIFSTRSELESCLELAESNQEREISGKYPGGDLEGTLAQRSSSSPSVQSETLPRHMDEEGRLLSSQIREFVAQHYLTSIPVVEQRKWHIRAYVLAIGRLKVYVFRGLLALLASETYQPPWENSSLKSSLSNTTLQHRDESVQRESRRDFWEMPDDLLPGDWKNGVFRQICSVSAELLRAAAHTMPDKLILMDCCFELFALDFLLDSSGKAWLLEANETPAFYEHGVAGVLAQRLLASVICEVMKSTGKGQCNDPAHESDGDLLVEVLDETEYLGICNIRQVLPEESGSSRG